MAGSTLSDHQFQQALVAVESASAEPIEKAEMLMEIAMGIQQKPGSARQLSDAVALYDRAIELCQNPESVLVARIRARKGTALQAIPGGGQEQLLLARAEFESAFPILEKTGTAEEIAEINMNLGVVLQALVGVHKAKITDSINAYQRALRTFSREKYPTEYAILHNNLATAFLSVPTSDERARMREALAVQSFENALKVITLEEQPSEYAMLQNNLGNALQYVSSGHAAENNLRALAAYDEALKVRTPEDTPVEYANTISNKANCLSNLADRRSPLNENSRSNLREACRMYREAKEIFHRFSDTDKVLVIEEALAEIEKELSADKASFFREGNFGESRV